MHFHAVYHIHAKKTSCCSINLHHLQILTSRFEIKGDLYIMKATGIVRRIEECGIITPRAIKPHKHWVFTDFVQKNFEETSGFRL